MQIKEYSKEEQEKIAQAIKKYTKEDIIPLRKVEYGDYVGFVYEWMGYELETISFSKNSNVLFNRTIQDLKSKSLRKILYNYTKKGT